MSYVYILYNESNDKFYIGYTQLRPEERLKQHNEKFFKDAFTSQYREWTLYFFIECRTNLQALKIEKHIKNMKSRKYIADLVKYPEIAKRLLKKYENY